MSNLVALSNAIRGVVDPRNTLACYSTQIGRSRFNRIGVNRVAKMIFGDTWPAPGDGAWLTPKTRFSAICVIVPSLVILGQTIRAYGMVYTRVLRPTRHSIGHFGDGGPEQ